jgi:hypothetical protein
MNFQKQDAQVAANRIRKKVGITESVNTAFNQSSGMQNDILRAIMQKSEETSIIFKLLVKTWTSNFSSVDNRTMIIDQLKNHQTGHEELIVFSHSQGNFYANIACDDMEKKFKNIQIASPTNNIRCGKKSNYTTLSSDEMYQLVNNLSQKNNRLPASVLDFKNNLYKLFGETVTQYIAQNIRTTPPMKWNVSQPNSTVALGSDGDLFEKHSMNNYLSYPPSIEHIKSNYQEVLNSVKSDVIKIPLVSKTISCSNVDKYLNSQLNINGDFTVNKTSYHPDSFHTYSIIKEGSRYSILEESHFFYFLIIAIILIICAPFLIKIFIIVSATITSFMNSDDEESQTK